MPLSAPWRTLPTSVKWEDRSVLGKAAFPRFKPRLTVRDQLGMKSTMPQQVYISQDRRLKQRQMQKFLSGLQDPDRTLQLRWTLSKELPSFSPAFLSVYLSRYAKVDAVYQLAANSCIVVFKDARAAQTILCKHDLGLPYGKLHIKRWNVAPQDDTVCRIAKYAETMNTTRAKFNSLMKQDRIHGLLDPARADAMLFALRHKYYGPNLTRYVTDMLPYNTFDTSGTTRLG